MDLLPIYTHLFANMIRKSPVIFMGSAENTILADDHVTKFLGIGLFFAVE